MWVVVICKKQNSLCQRLFAAVGEQTGACPERVAEGAVVTNPEFGTEIEIFVCR